MKKAAAVSILILVGALTFVQASAQEQPKWINFKGAAIETGDSYLLLDWDGKRGLELNKADVTLDKGQAKIRVGAQAKRMIRNDGNVEVMTVNATTTNTPDRRTCCVGLAQTCCANGRVIHACIGVAGCDFGDDDNCD